MPACSVDINTYETQRQPSFLTLDPPPCFMRSSAYIALVSLVIGSSITAASFSTSLLGSTAAVGVVVTAVWVQWRRSCFSCTSTCQQIIPIEPGSLEGQTILITGGSSGLGLESAKQLVGSGARIIVTARTEAKGQAAVQIVLDYCQKQQQAINNNNNYSIVPCLVEYKVLELEDIQGIQQTVDGWKDTTIRQIDVLLLNAGVMALPERQVTADFGIEKQMATNHLGPFVLTATLARSLLLTKRARIIVVSSAAHETIPDGLDFDYIWKANTATDYNPWRSYASSKLANILFAQHLQRLVDSMATKSTTTSDDNDDNSVIDWAVSSLHPGTVDTPLWRHVISKEMPAAWSRLTVEQGALTQIWLAAAAPQKGGQYFVNCEAVELQDFAKDPVAAERLWRESEELSGVRFAWPTNYR
jgi:NAD(P)-dependent dehydrogenase (short-subunit alcohol dehydrogenase family)